jgi:hypothetical protein
LFGKANVQMELYPHWLDTSFSFNFFTKDNKPAFLNLTKIIGNHKSKRCQGDYIDEYEKIINEVNQRRCTQTVQKELRNENVKMAGSLEEVMGLTATYTTNYQQKITKITEII